jgi:hypothetical protein
MLIKIYRFSFVNCYLIWVSKYIFFFVQVKNVDILADSARKRNRKEVLANYNKTRINIDHQQDRLMELMEALGVQTYAEV